MIRFERGRVGLEFRGLAESLPAQAVGPGEVSCPGFPDNSTHLRPPSKPTSTPKRSSVELLCRPCAKSVAHPFKGVHLSDNFCGVAKSLRREHCAIDLEQEKCTYGLKYPLRRQDVLQRPALLALGGQVQA